MQPGWFVGVRICIGAFTCVLGASCGARTQPESPAKSRGLAGTSSTGTTTGPWVLSTDDTGAVDPRASALIQWVVPLKKGSSIACSATAITPNALLTAAHCVDADAPAIPDVSGYAWPTIPMNHRACGHGANGSCADPFPVDEYGYFETDIATIWLDDAQPVSEAPVLGRLFSYGAVPSAFMLSARTGRAHPVCRAQATGDVAQASGWVDKGDSGSSVVAISTSGAPVIIGVVSHRWQAQGRWYFAMIPNVLPWPEAATSDAPPIAPYAEWDFSAIQDCQ